MDIFPYEKAPNDCPECQYKLQLEAYSNEAFIMYCPKCNNRCKIVRPRKSKGIIDENRNNI
jgi:hypothetical protein